MVSYLYSSLRKRLAMNAVRPTLIRSTVVATAVFSAALLAACSRSGAETAAAPAVRPVIAQTVVAGGRERIERYSGEVHARYEAPIAFRIDGKISHRAVGIGDRVNAGQDRKSTRLNSSH